MLSKKKNNTLDSKEPTPERIADNMSWCSFFYEILLIRKVEINGIFFLNL